MREDRLEQRLQIAAAHVRRRTRIAMQCRRIDHRKIELLFGRAQFVEQIERVVDDPVGTRAGPVDFVDDNDRLQALRERLACHKARLRHRALDRVHQQQHAIDHRQHALDFAAEVRMARRVDDVDVRSLVVDRAVFCEDRDAALTLEVVAVHHALGQLLILAERAGLLQQFVDQRGLAVINVRDDRDVSNWAFHRRLSFVFSGSLSYSLQVVPARRHPTR